MLLHQALASDWLVHGSLSTTATVLQTSRGNIISSRSAPPSPGMRGEGLMRSGELLCLIQNLEGLKISQRLLSILTTMHLLVNESHQYGIFNVVCLARIVPYKCISALLSPITI